MAYIYKITNDINQKIYIGKTEFSIEKRFKEHCKDAFKDRNEKRPLYAAMRKYGIEHFYVELIEETNEPEGREKYWIEQYRSFKYGYNATIGGDGKRYLDYDLLIAAYKELGSVKAVCDKYNCDNGYLGKILRENGFDTVEYSHQLSIQKNGIVVNQYDKQGNYIKTFPSAAQALREVSPNTNSKSGGVSHILDVCRGKRKTAYGYIWRFSASTIAAAEV